MWKFFFSSAVAAFCLPSGVNWPSAEWQSSREHAADVLPPLVQSAQRGMASTRPVRSCTAWALVCRLARSVLFCLSSDETGGRCIDAVVWAPPPSFSSDPQLLLRLPPLSGLHPATPFIAEACFHCIPRSPLAPPPPTASPHSPLHTTAAAVLHSKNCIRKQKKQCCSLFSLSVYDKQGGKGREKKETWTFNVLLRAGDF